MINENISLNFLELVNSNFKFDVFRRAFESDRKEENTYRYKLPTANGDDKDFYEVSLTERSGYVCYKADSMDNINMTKKWLMNLLIEKVEKTIDKKDYVINRKFNDRILIAVSNHNEGCCMIKLEAYYLEANNSFGFIIDYTFKPNPGYENSKIEKILSLSIAKDGSKNKNYYSDKLKIITSFINSTVDKLFPIHDIEIKKSLTKLPASLLEEKLFVFNKGMSKNQFQGIKEFKPFFNNIKDPLFVFIFEKNKINVSRQLVLALRGQLYPTFSGMKDVFGIDFQNDNIKSIVVENFSEESLKYIESEIDNIAVNNPKSNIVGVFAGIEKDFDNNRKYSPYYSIKGMFLKRGLAIQAVTIEQALKKDGFKWSISGIALQLFVKLGGIPWKVKEKNNNCLILGISSAHIKDEQGKITKYFAYSLCFDSSGLYKRLNVLGQDEEKSSYIKQLSSQIKEQLEKDIDGTIKKCVIHVPFKLKREEIQCIKESVQSAKNAHDNVEFCIIKINVVNKFFGYSEFNSNVPIAGSCVRLGNEEFLIWFEGLRQGSTHVVSAQNISNPVHIKFLYGENMNEDKMDFYLQDIINLSGANWRGFNAKHEPVSTLYPELIAKFAGKFEQYGLNLEIGDSAMEKVWFI